MMDNVPIPEIGKEVNNPLSVLDKAEALAKRIEAGNLKAEELMKQNEAILARITLSGRAEAGSSPKPTPVLSDKELANKFLNGEINPFTN